jgi:hypothetical protein
VSAPATPEQQALLAVLARGLGAAYVPPVREPDSREAAAAEVRRLLVAATATGGRQNGQSSTPIAGL